MRPLRLLTVLLALLLIASPSALLADPSDKFLRAYMAAQNGEKLALENKPADARTQFRLAQNLLQEITTEAPDWQPIVVQYRLRKTEESLAAVEAKIGPEDDSAPVIADIPGYEEDAIEGPLPGQEFEPFPPSMEPGPSFEEPSNPSGAGDVIDNAMRELRQRLQQLEFDLNTSRREAVTMRQERDQLARQLATTDAQLRENIQRLDQSRLNETELRAELNTAREAIAAAQTDQTAQIEMAERITVLEAELSNATAERQLAELETDDLMVRLAAAETRTALAAEGMAAAESERDTLRDSNEKLVADQEAAAAEREILVAERDKALSELEVANANLVNAEQLAATNLDLMEKLTASEARIKELSDATAPEEVAELRIEIEELTVQLAAAQNQSATYETTISELQTKLAQTESDMESLQFSGMDSTEQQKLLAENTILRDIISREIQAQARREESRQLVYEELGRLEVQSASLIDQLDLITQPTMVLSEEEKALFRDSTVEGQEADVSLEIAAAKPDMDETSAPVVEMDRTPPVPSHLEPIAREAREYFQRGEYADAEELYEKILAEEPNNIYALSNLGVVRFRSGRLKAAELTFKKAIAIDDTDSFSHSTLGIVYYRQGQLDEAVDVLTRAIALNPKNPVAHNYLGITASQKGWQEAAQKELQAAIALNPNYADAHFNLAVVYAVADPPAKEMSRQHYNRAVELGAAPDPGLEALIQ